PDLLDERGAAPAAVDERVDGQRSAPVRHRRGGSAAAPGQPALPVGNPADRALARGGRGPGADDRCRHGRCAQLGPRPDGRARCAVPPRSGPGMRILAAALFAMLVAACARPAPEGVTELVYASPYSPSHPFSRADIRWMEFVEERSGGTLRIRPVWSGGLLSSEMSMEELRHGVADIGLVTPIYVRGGTHLIRMQSGFYSGVDSIESQVALFRCLERHTPQIAEELAGLKVLAVQGGLIPGIVTRDRPVRSLADLKGLRLRAPTELLRVLERIGADPVN